MTSSNNILAAMQSVQTYLYRFGCPVLILTGTAGCILNLTVFTQKPLRKNPCSIYLIAYNVSNFVYIYSSLLSLTLDVGYNIDPSSHNLVVCRLHLYITILFNVLSPCYLILASIHRILVTSLNARTRWRSTRCLAYICVVSGTFFWALFHSHALIVSNIIQLAPNYFLCYFQQGVHLIFVSYYALIKQITAVSLMIICGLCSIKNIRSRHRVRRVPNLCTARRGVQNSSRSTSSKDRQLTIVLCMDITTFTLFGFVFGMFLMYQQITQNYMKSVDQIQIEAIVGNVCLFSGGTPFCTSCYAYLIVSKTFRNELKKLFPWRRIICNH